jgi:hypothetical protein
MVAHLLRDIAGVVGTAGSATSRLGQRTWGHPRSKVPDFLRNVLRGGSGHLEGGGKVATLRPMVEGIATGTSTAWKALDHGRPRAQVARRLLPTAADLVADDFSALHVGAGIVRPHGRVRHTQANHRACGSPETTGEWSSV